MKSHRSQAVILDTEYTSWEGSLERNWSEPDEHREIVQIAAIIVDINSLEEVDHISILTKPRINPLLSNYFIELTGISNEVVHLSKSFYDGIKEYTCFVGERPVFACGDEGKIIDENLQINAISGFSELTSVHNLRPWFRKNGLNADKIPSGELHKHLGIELYGVTHNALHDVRSILVSVKHLVKNGAYIPFVR